MTPAGRVNLFGVFGGLLLVIGGGVFDVIEAIVHTWNASYETGFPSFGSIFRTYVILLLGSVLMLVLGEAFGRRRG